MRLVVLDGAVPCTASGASGARGAGSARPPSSAKPPRRDSSRRLTLRPTRPGTRPPPGSKWALDRHRNPSGPWTVPVIPVPGKLNIRGPGKAVLGTSGRGSIRRLLTGGAHSPVLTGTSPGVAHSSVSTGTSQGGCFQSDSFRPNSSVSVIPVPGKLIIRALEKQVLGSGAGD